MIEMSDPKPTSIIPEGDYCYRITRIEFGKIFTNNCPYSQHKIIAEVYIPYCAYLDKMGIPNCDDEDFEKLVAFYGTRDKVHEAMPLSLLWDSCKECGINEEELLNS